MREVSGHDSLRRNPRRHFRERLIRLKLDPVLGGAEILVASGFDLLFQPLDHQPEARRQSALHDGMMDSALEDEVQSGVSTEQVMFQGGVGTGYRCRDVR